ncbi:galactokinase, partial [Streptomyces sp. DSM 41640]|nr:galactokinase [Streptomyces sp. DSM 41640]
IPTLRDLPYEDLGAALTTLADAGADESVIRYVRHVVGDNRRVEQVIALLDAGDARGAGPVLDEGHRSLRDDLRVSCPELDLAVAAARGAGALGARMTGGGFGGSAVVLAEAAGADAVAEAVTKAIAGAGHAAPGIFTA